MIATKAPPQADSAYCLASMPAAGEIPPKVWQQMESVECRAPWQETFFKACASEEDGRPSTSQVTNPFALSPRNTPEHGSQVAVCNLNACPAAMMGGDLPPVFRAICQKWCADNLQHSLLMVILPQGDSIHRLETEVLSSIEGEKRHCMFLAGNDTDNLLRTVVAWSPGDARWEHIMSKKGLMKVKGLDGGAPLLTDSRPCTCCAFVQLTHPSFMLNFTSM